MKRRLVGLPFLILLTITSVYADLDKKQNIFNCVGLTDPGKSRSCYIGAIHLYMGIKGQPHYVFSTVKYDCLAQIKKSDRESNAKFIKCIENKIKSSIPQINDELEKSLPDYETVFKKVCSTKRIQSDAQCIDAIARILETQYESSRNLKKAVYSFTPSICREYIPRGLTKCLLDDARRKWSPASGTVPADQSGE